MAVQLITVKVISPYYGQSIYVWTNIIAFTLGGLALGYYTGGYLSERFSGVKVLFYNLFISALILTLTPFISVHLLKTTILLGFHIGVTLSCFVILLAPLICFGIVSPVLIRLISTDLTTTGRSAGIIYGISTFGGIVLTFVMAFYFIPIKGLLNSYYLTAFILFTCCVLCFLYRKRS